MSGYQYIEVNYAEPHVGRTQAILKAHPEIGKLAGYTPITALYTFFVVALQFAVAATVAESPWWVIALAGYLVGAYADHALFVIIHDCAHNLAFRKSASNKLLSIFANLPNIFPCAILFRGYHLLHHKYQGEFDYDADLPGPIESRIFGKSVIGKALWLMFFFVMEGVVRPSRLKSVKLYDGWAFLNIAVQVVAMTGVVLWLGWGAFGYLAASSIFCIGLHPLGARWIQEHFVVKAGQETYSYYGPLNKLSFNVGFHNEHHDFMGISWMHLPKVRAAAPEFYDTLYFHRSWTKLFFQFLFDPNLNLRSRVIRPSHKDRVKTTRNTENIVHTATDDSRYVAKIQAQDSGNRPSASL